MSEKLTISQGKIFRCFFCEPFPLTHVAERTTEHGILESGESRGEKLVGTAVKEKGRPPERVYLLTHGRSHARAFFCAYAAKGGIVAEAPCFGKGKRQHGWMDGISRNPETPQPAPPVCQYPKSDTPRQHQIFLFGIFHNWIYPGPYGYQKNNLLWTVQNDHPEPQGGTT